LNYVRLDKDPTVRQWAVEGMRFLAKTKFSTNCSLHFTEDPPNAVRDAQAAIFPTAEFSRAAAHGHGAKAHRFGNEPRTTGQMRNWTFLALQEITDETCRQTPRLEPLYQEHGPKNGRVRNA